MLGRRRQCVQLASQSTDNAWRGYHLRIDGIGEMVVSPPKKSLNPQHSREQRHAHIGLAAPEFLDANRTRLGASVTSTTCAKRLENRLAPCRQNGRAPKWFWTPNLVPSKSAEVEPFTVTISRSFEASVGATEVVWRKSWRAHDDNRSPQSVGTMPFGACGDNTASKIFCFRARVGLCAVVEDRLSF